MCDKDNLIGPVQQEQFLKTLNRRFQKDYSNFIEKIDYLEPLDGMPGRLKVFVISKMIKSFYQTLLEQKLELCITIENRTSHLMIDIDEERYHILRKKAQDGKSTKVNGSTIGTRSIQLLLIGLGFHDATVVENSESAVTVELSVEHRCLQLMYGLDHYRQHDIKYVCTGTSIEISINPETNYQTVISETVKAIDRLSIPDFNKMSSAGKIRFLLDYLDPDILSEVLQNFSTQKNEVFQEASYEAIKKKFDTLGIVLVQRGDPVQLIGTSLVPKTISIDDVLKK